MIKFNNQLELTAYWEQGPDGGPALKAYKCPAGKLTIGFGETMPGGKPVTPNMTCTDEQATEWLAKRMDTIKLDLRRLACYPYMTFKGPTFILDPVIDYAYNVGVNGFPSLLSKLKAHDREGSSLEFLDGIYANGKPLLGLLLRRISEYHTFTTCEYVAYEKDDPITQDLKNKLLMMNSKNQAAVNMINGLKIQG